MTNTFPESAPQQVLDLAPDTPTIRRARMRVPNVEVALFVKNEWPLHALGGATGTEPRTLKFDRFPEAFQSAAKHIAYLLINEPTPAEYFNQPGGLSVLWPPAGSILQTMSVLGDLMKFIQQISDTEVRQATNRGSQVAHGVTSPGDLDQGHLQRLRELIESPERGWPPGRQNSLKRLLIRLPHWNPWLPPELRWEAPEWGQGDWSTKVPDTGVNVFKPIPQRTMAPLLTWALTLVQAGPEILNAFAERERIAALAKSGTYSTEKARRALQKYRDEGLPLPARRHGTVISLEASYLAGVHGTDSNAIAQTRTREFTDLPLSSDPKASALNVQVSTTMDGKPWIDCLCYDDFAWQGKGAQPLLLRHLRTACIIVTDYLTGMRPQEVMTLERGCAREPLLSASGHELHLIDGYVHKRTAHGQEEAAHEREAATPAVWATIQEAADAVAVAQAINDGLDLNTPFLFPMPHQPERPQDGSDFHNTVQMFIAFVNARLATVEAGLEVYAIDLDEDDDPINLSRFRRTLAWFVRNQPNGHVTLAVQYQHLSVTQGRGYASVQASGVPELLQEEGWNARRRTLERIAEHLSNGGGVAGPGAKHVVEAALTLPRVESAKGEERLASSPRYTVRDNPYNGLLCAGVEENALCEKVRLTGKDTEPNLGDCRPQCHNIAFTDDQVVERRAAVAELQANAALVPLESWRLSLLAQAEAIQQTLDEGIALRLTEESFAGGDA